MKIKSSTNKTNEEYLHAQACKYSSFVLIEYLIQTGHIIPTPCIM